MSVMESGAAKLDITPTRLKKLIEDCIEVVRSQCDEKNIRLETDLPDRLPVMDVDKRLLQVATMNILGNAVKYTRPGGTITVFTTSTDSEILLHVRDSGIGISESDMPRIFEKFYRCPSEEVAQAAGSGIGLATAQQIVCLHGGQIRVTSKVGEGSVFTIALPRSRVNASHGE
jgi:two-component system phosphate regulon sensor histidine kinase PhoR